MEYLPVVSITALVLTCLALLWGLKSAADRFRDFAETTNHRNDELLRTFANRMLSISEDASAQHRNELDAGTGTKPPAPPKLSIYTGPDPSPTFNSPPDLIGD